MAGAASRTADVPDVHGGRPADDLLQQQRRDSVEREFVARIFAHTTAGLDRWVERAKRAAEMSKTLVYERTGEDDKYLPLIMSPENARAAVGDSSQAPFVVANSMREVQPDINILVSPIPERLFARKPEGVPDWVLPVVEES